MNAVAILILAKLGSAQREFILRMKPHLRSRRISASDWNNIEPCVDYSDGFPDVYWFGGMRKNWRADGRAIMTFQFNQIGLEVRSALSASLPAASASTEAGKSANVTEADVREGSKP